MALDKAVVERRMRISRMKKTSNLINGIGQLTFGTGIGFATGNGLSTLERKKID